MNEVNLAVTYIFYILTAKIRKGYFEKDITKIGEPDITIFGDTLEKLLRYFCPRSQNLEPHTPNPKPQTP